MTRRSNNPLAQEMPPLLRAFLAGGDLPVRLPEPPKPVPVDPHASAAAFILASGRKARGEEYDEGESNDQRRGPQPKKQPGQIVLDVVERQRKEREGK
jgi:hypothetical protein